MPKLRKTIKIKKINKIIGTKRLRKLITFIRKRCATLIHQIQSVEKISIRNRQIDLFSLKGKALPASVDKKSIDMDHDF